MDKKLLSLFQLCDSNFPSGGFSHSFGMETYIQQKKVTNSETFSQWLSIYLQHQLVTADGLAIKLAFNALKKKDFGKIWQLDQLLTVQNLSSEGREGTRFMGRSLIKIAKTLYNSSLLFQYDKRIKNKESFAHPAIVFALIGNHLKLSKDTTIQFYLYSTIINLVQNAVRAIPIGQTAGQQIINAFQSKIQKSIATINKLNESDFGTIAPGIEMAQMQHENLTVRIFMS